MTETHNGTPNKELSSDAAAVRKELKLTGFITLFLGGKLESVIDAVVKARNGEQAANTARREVTDDLQAANDEITEKEDTIRILRDELSKTQVRLQILEYTQDLTLQEGENGVFTDSSPVTYYIVGGSLRIRRDGYGEYVFYYGAAGLGSEELGAFHHAMDELLDRNPEPTPDLDATLAELKSGNVSTAPDPRRNTPTGTDQVHPSGGSGFADEPDGPTDRT